MINKRRSFTDNNVAYAELTALIAAHRLESALSALALDFSIHPERSVPWTQVQVEFARLNMRGYKPTDEDSKAFDVAAKTAHRMESSVRVERWGTQDHYDEMTEHEVLVLRFKFYYKEDRQEFLEWRIAVGAMGHIQSAGMTGHGALGQIAMK